MEKHINNFIDYLENVKKSSSNTISAYTRDLKKLQGFLDNLNVSNVRHISETLLNSYILHMEKEGFSSSSVARNIASIKAFMLYLIKNGHISSDPSERIKAPKVETKAPRTLDLDQINQLLDMPDLSTKKELGIRLC